MRLRMRIDIYRIELGTKLQKKNVLYIHIVMGMP